MSHASRHSHIFDIPLAKPARGKRDASDVIRDRKYADLIELEFSEYGRDTCFPSGWFVVPVFVLASAVIVVVLTL